MRGERRQYLCLLRFRHLEQRQGPTKLSRHFVKLRRRNFQGAMGFFQAEIGVTRVRGRVLERAAGDLAKS